MQPSAPSNPDRVSTRRFVYRLLIVVAVGMGLGRILSTVLVIEPNVYTKPRVPGTKKWPEEGPPAAIPSFSSNDRSRLATVRALVDHGTYAIGHTDFSQPSVTSSGKRLSYTPNGIIFEDGWGSVDKVLAPESKAMVVDGRKIRLFYSTKPPLYPTILAGEYWALKRIFGWSLADANDRWIVMRVLLITFNLLPFALSLFLLSHLLEMLGTTDWGRFYVLAAACFGTMLTPFLITINNHLPAACSAMIALYAAARIYLAPEINGKTTASCWWFVVAGFFAGFAACNELPAAAFLAGLFFLLTWSYAGRTFTFFLPAALLPIGGYFLTNYLAIGELVPIQARFGSEWYTYEGSHWRVEPGQVKTGIDWAGMKESRKAYAFHLLVGHHGLFSLMPVFLLAVGGMIWGACRICGQPRNNGLPLKDLNDSQDPAAFRTRSAMSLWCWHSFFTLILSAVVIGFYLVRTTNYGGWSNGPRWLMWMTPFWLLAMLPLVDRMSKSRVGSFIACALLLLSIMAMSYRLWNPWRHPWIYNWMDSNGLIPYDR